MNKTSRLASLLAAAGCVASLTACGAAGRTTLHEAPELASVLRSGAHDTDLLIDSRWVTPELRPRLHELPPTSADTLASQGEVMAAPALALPADRQWAFVDAACQAVDLYDAFTGTPEDMVTYVLSQDDSFLGRATAAYELVGNLAEADDAGDLTLVLARANLRAVAEANAS